MCLIYKRYEIGNKVIKTRPKWAKKCKCVRVHVLTYSAKSFLGMIYNRMPIGVPKGRCRQCGFVF